MSNSDTPPILGYATPNYVGDAIRADQLYFVFERPDAKKDVLMRCVGALTAAAGLAIIVPLSYLHYRGSGEVQPLIGFVLLLGAFAMTVVFCACSWHLLRTWRFRDAPVTIRVAEGHIIVSDPVRVGPYPRVLPLGEIRRCFASYEGPTMGEQRPYRIIFRMRSFRQRRVSVQVAVGEKGIVERAVADLQRVVELHAQQR